MGETGEGEEAFNGRFVIDAQGACGGIGEGRVLGIVTPGERSGERKVCDLLNTVRFLRENAIRRAKAEAAAATGRNEVVLLSPAAASFDQYPDFEARGEAFRAAVLALGATPAGAS